MIGFQDFKPEMKDRGGFLRAAQFEELKGALERANEWIEQHSVNVIHVETVVLPNIYSEEGTEDVSLHTSGEYYSTWHQIIRVWYQW